jgi:hypothetical protein
LEGYKTLFTLRRHRNSVVMISDCDSLLADEVGVEVSFGGEW